MTRNLRNRIQALERIRSAVLKDRQQIANGALSGLSLTTLELLYSGLAAPVVGRSPTSEENEARKEYMEDLTRDCRLAGYSSVEGFEDALDVHQIRIILIAIRMPPSELQLAKAGREAQRDGRVPTLGESAALELCDAYTKHLIDICYGRALAGAELKVDSPC
jgi:hypothetical protein